MVTSADVAFPLLTGIAVVLITLLADRLGGRLGGLLATAPITTSAAHIMIVLSVPPAAAPARVLLGGTALLAGTFGILAFFYTVKYTRGHSDNGRLATGLVTYLATFLTLTLLFARFPIHPVSAFVILFSLHAALSFTFMREPVPILDGHARRPRRGIAELAGRFAAGAVTITVIRYLLVVYPTLAGALAVVPAVFVVSLTVMGLRQNAPFAARASQAGLYGTTAVGLFVLTIAGTLALGIPIWGGIPLAWGAYATTLFVLGNLHQRIAR